MNTRHDSGGYALPADRRPGEGGHRAPRSPGKPGGWTGCPTRPGRFQPGETPARRPTRRGTTSAPAAAAAPADHLPHRILWAVRTPALPHHAPLLPAESPASAAAADTASNPRRGTAAQSQWPGRFAQGNG